MTFSIFDTGNLVASYDDEQVALDALTRLVRDDPESAAEIALLRFDDLGEPVGDPVVGSSVLPRQAA
jgi:hypothetical protein